MNYDSSISLNVNLSRVLDELIIDGTNLETIVQFLKSHERDIPDIYRNSSMVYNLYDFVAHPYRVDPFLVEHINDLRTVNFCFALNSLATFLNATGASMTILNEIRSRFRGVVELVKFSRNGWDGVNAEDRFFRCEMNLVDWLNKTNDSRDYRMLISHSFLAMSAFQASTFMQLCPASQFLLLKTIQEEVLATGRNYRVKFESGVVYSVYGEMVCTLLRQILSLNRVDMFNWVVDVLNLKERYGSSTILLSVVRDSLSKMIPKSLRDMVDISGYDYMEKVSYEEVVFEMNLLNNGFEQSNLFLYIYLDNDYLLQGMKDNKDLMEFFNLPFDWDELNWLKDDHKVNVRQSPF
jgi:hypothetical protein